MDVVEMCQSPENKPKYLDVSQQRQVVQLGTVLLGLQWNCFFPFEASVYPLFRHPTWKIPGPKHAPASDIPTQALELLRILCLLWAAEFLL